jgi:hypothetical protein
VPLAALLLDVLEHVRRQVAYKMKKHGLSSPWKK